MPFLSLSLSPCSHNWAQSPHSERARARGVPFPLLSALLSHRVEHVVRVGRPPALLLRGGRQRGRAAAPPGGGRGGGGGPFGGAGEGLEGGGGVCASEEGGAVDRPPAPAPSHCAAPSLCSLSLSLHTYLGREQGGPAAAGQVGQHGWIERERGRREAEGKALPLRKQLGTEHLRPLRSHSRSWAPLPRPQHALRLAGAPRSPASLSFRRRPCARDVKRKRERAPHAPFLLSLRCHSGRGPLALPLPSNPLLCSACPSRPPPRPASTINSSPSGHTKRPTRPLHSQPPPLRRSPSAGAAPPASATLPARLARLARASSRSSTPLPTLTTNPSTTGPTSSARPP